MICTGLWDRRGIILVDFLIRGQTANAERYCKTLHKLRRPTRNKRRSMLTAGVVLFNDNARPHMARWSAHLLEEFSWEVFNHPSYSPNLAPNDFHFFLHLKKFLPGQRQRLSFFRRRLIYVFGLCSFVNDRFDWLYWP